MGSLFFLLAGVVAGESWGVLEGVSSRLLLFTVRDWGTLATRVSRAMCSSSRRWSPAITFRTKSTYAGSRKYYSWEQHNNAIRSYSQEDLRWQVCTCQSLHESKLTEFSDIRYFAMKGGKESTQKPETKIKVTWADLCPDLNVILYYTYTIL